MSKEHVEEIRFLTMAELSDPKRTITAKDAGWQSECSYRRGAHQALAVIRDWLDSHPGVDPMDGLSKAEDIACELRYGPHTHRDFFMDRLIEKLHKKLKLKPRGSKS